MPQKIEALKAHKKELRQRLFAGVWDQMSDTIIEIAKVVVKYVIVIGCNLEEVGIL